VAGTSLPRLNQAGDIASTQSRGQADPPPHPARRRGVPPRGRRAGYLRPENEPRARPAASGPRTPGVRHHL